MLPARLAKIVAFFEPLGEVERRENLVAYAERAVRCAPRPGEVFAVQEVRKDAECSDTVGIFLRIDPQALTRALAAILCDGLEAATPAEIRALPADFVPKIVGSQLVRLRSQTVYYLLRRLKSAVQTLRPAGHATET
jgi:cysteine desulfuration protein SufE